MEGIPMTMSRCTRCGAPVQYSGRPPGQDARLLRLAKTPVGHCAACAMTNWLQNSEAGRSPLRGIIDAKGPAILLDERVIEQMARVLQAGCADADPREIDWVSVVVNWDLPFGADPPAPHDQATLF
jgi:hypothetical protein